MNNNSEPLFAIVHGLHFGCNLGDFIFELLQEKKRKEIRKKVN